MLERVSSSAAAERPSTAAAGAEPASDARAAGLRYVSDAGPGIRRRRRGAGFSYVEAQGRTVRDAAQLARIRALAIPPAWTSVWICPLPNGHLQATGRDARGRKQYRYHAAWRVERDATKFNRMVAFGEALPRLRARVAADLALPGLPRAKVLAAVVRLLETTLIRVGNEEYVRQNHSFGLTTLRNRHVEIDGAELRFQFRGKSGKLHSVAVADRRLARVVRACRDLPGHELFQYLDEEGARQSVGSEDVNDYLREVTGEDLSAKDFRTWGGTVLALSALAAVGCAGSAGATTRSIADAVKQVAEQLGNRPAVCRRYYIHPAVLEAFAAGRLPADLTRAGEAGEASNAAALSAVALPATGLHSLERQVLALLRGLPPGGAPGEAGGVRVVGRRLSGGRPRAPRRRR